MNCMSFRQAVLADPYHLSDEARAHRGECLNCARFLKEVESLDDAVRDAVQVAVPEGLAAKVLLNQSLQPTPRRPTRRYWLGMAASFLLAVFIVQLIPLPGGSALQADIINHMEKDAHQVHGKSGSVDEAFVRYVLDAVGGELTQPIGNVTYASTCVIDGQLVAHLVVEQGNETYTLLVMPQSPERPEEFTSGRWQGTILPDDNGSIAVISSVGDVSDEVMKEKVAYFQAAVAS